MPKQYERITLSSKSLVVRVKEELDSLSAPPGIPSPALLQPSAFHLFCSLPPFHAAWAPTQGVQRIDAKWDRCCNACLPHQPPAAGEAQLSPSVLRWGMCSHREQQTSTSQLRGDRAQRAGELSSPLPTEPEPRAYTGSEPGARLAASSVQTSMSAVLLRAFYFAF